MQLKTLKSRGKKVVGKPYEGEPHVRFDAAGAGNVVRPNDQTGAPAPDPTVSPLASPNNLRFAEARALAEGFGVRLSRVRGGHHIFVHPEIQELVNLQEVGRQAKAYQVRQLLQLVERYNLGLEDE